MTDRENTANTLSLSLLILLCIMPVSSSYDGFETLWAFYAVLWFEKVIGCGGRLRGGGTQAAGGAWNVVGGFPLCVKCKG